jgi:hypothetical protein
MDGGSERDGDSSRGSQPFPLILLLCRPALGNYDRILRDRGSARGKRPDDAREKKERKKEREREEKVKTSDKVLQRDRDGGERRG